MSFCAKKKNPQAAQRCVFTIRYNKVIFLQLWCNLAKVRRGELFFPFRKYLLSNWTQKWHWVMFCLPLWHTATYKQTRMLTHTQSHSFGMSITSSASSASPLSSSALSLSPSLSPSSSAASPLNICLGTQLKGLLAAGGAPVVDG